MIRKIGAFTAMCAILAACTTGDRKVNNNEQLAREYFDHFNNRNWEKMTGMYTDTVAFKDPEFGTDVVLQTHQQIIAKYRGMQTMFPDIRDSIVQLYPSGDKHVIVEFVSTGSSGDSIKFTLPICTIFEFRDGKISKDYTYYNMGEGQ
ncbi:nuclear transport factor 2 family protein [Chitinophaga horti]|uniref:Nuclear transport factor 2 family protein n=1 Tax=Chitinophaga horti TaxID=2920382 RepID=A0ABY6J876_9BACT|nr:nuclear transport factor 2 family protein [Chitinophaga horti]UYQ94484.1 nuclear transport factor 2 family protein [Chitinophaga horti]